MEKPLFTAAMAELHRLSGAVHAVLAGLVLREGDGAQSVEDLAYSAAQLLLSEKSAVEELAAAILRREQIAPTFVAPHVILLHARITHTGEPHFGVLRLAEPLSCGEEMIRMALVMCAPKEGDAGAIVLGRIAAQIAERPAFMDILAQGSGEEIRRELEYVLEEYVRECLEQLL